MIGRLLSIEMMLLSYLYLVCMAPLVFADELKFAEQDSGLQRGIDLNGKMIVLKSVHNRYVVAEDTGEANANRQRIGVWEEFKVEFLGNFKIALKSFHNKYLVAESNGEANANREIRDTWETFTIEFVDANRVALKSFHNKYLVAEADGRLNANRDQRGPWEIFTMEIIPPGSVSQRLIDLEGRIIALKTYSGRYVVAESNGEANANRLTKGPWEEFTFESLGNSKIALKSHHNKYLVAELNGQINANRDRRDTYETFTIEFRNHGRVALKTYHNQYLQPSVLGHLDAFYELVIPWTSDLQSFTIEVVR